MYCIFSITKYLSLIPAGVCGEAEGKSHVTPTSGLSLVKQTRLPAVTPAAYDLPATPESLLFPSEMYLYIYTRKRDAKPCFKMIPTKVWLLCGGSVQMLYTLIYSIYTVHKKINFEILCFFNI